jgi:hypothetical protein
MFSTRSAAAADRSSSGDCGEGGSCALDVHDRAAQGTVLQHEQAVRTQAGPEQLRVVDARLHLQIAEYANNRFLTMTQSFLQEMLGRSMDTTLSVAGRPARPVRDHAEIVNALVAHDAPRARAAARRHIRSARRAALRRVAEDRQRPTRRGDGARLTGSSGRAPLPDRPGTSLRQPGLLRIH